MKFSIISIIKFELICIGHAVIRSCSREDWFRFFL